MKTYVGNLKSYLSETIAIKCLIIANITKKYKKAISICISNREHIWTPGKTQFYYLLLDSLGKITKKPGLLCLTLKIVPSLSVDARLVLLYMLITKLAKYKTFGIFFSFFHENKVTFHVNQFIQRIFT